MKLGLSSMLLVFASILAATGVLHFAVAGLVIDGFAKAEAEEARKRALNVTTILAELTSDFRKLGQDWAIWTDAVEFVVRPTPAFVADITKDVFAGKNWHQMAYVTVDGRRAYEGELSSSGVVGKPSRAFEDLLDAGGVVFQPSEERAVEGFVSLDGVPHFVASQPLRDSENRPAFARFSP